MELEVPFADEVRDPVRDRRTRIRGAVDLDLIRVRAFRAGLCLTERMQSRLHRVVYRVDQAHITQLAVADFNYPIGLGTAARLIHPARPHRLLEDTCRLAEVTDVRLVVVEGPIGLVAPRYRLNRAVAEYRERYILALGALLVVEHAGAFPEDLLEGRRPCLHAPAGVGAQDALDER